MLLHVCEQLYWCYYMYVHSYIDVSTCMCSYNYVITCMCTVVLMLLHVCVVIIMLLHVCAQLYWYY